MITTDKESQQLKNRFCDLAKRTYNRNIYSFTGFLTLAEQDIFHSSVREFPNVPYTLSGGMEGCERVMVRFGNDELLGYAEDFPILCLQIKPLQAKFADDLSHRDVLGACMHLGIERSTIGDIYVRDKEVYLFCTETIAPFIMENLTRIRHTSVICAPYTESLQLLAPVWKEKLIQVASERLDAVISKVYNLSRTDSLELFRAQKVFSNGKLQENNSALPKAGEIISVRGYGRFRYEGLQNLSKKGKCNVLISTPET